MTQPPNQEPKGSRLDDLKQQQQGKVNADLRRYGLIFGGIILVMVVGFFLVRLAQTPPISPTPTSDQAQENGTVQTLQAQLTAVAALVTPTIDPNIQTLQAGGTQLAQQLTLAAEQPTQPPITVPPTQAQVIVQPTQPPVIVTPQQVITATFTPQAQAVASVSDPMQVQLGICAQQATRESRLDCATQYYLQLGQGLAGVKGYIRSLGATWAKLDITLPFQPDSDQLGSGGIRIWGARIQADTLTVSGNTCLTTDVPSRLGHYGWHFLDMRLNPPVYHVGNGSTAPGQVVDIVFDGDCTDWPEIVAAMNNSSSASQPAQTLACLSLSDLSQLGRIIQELSNNGQLAGAQLAFNQTWTAPAGWTIQKNGQVVTSVNAGDTASAWSPDACRPLAR